MESHLLKTIDNSLNRGLLSFRTKFQTFPIVRAVHYQRTVHAMTSSRMQLCSKTDKTKEVVLGSVIAYGMTPFLFQTAQKNSASLRSSVQQFENSNDVNRAL